MRICLAVPNTLSFPQGGHLWLFMNWALGFKALGHDVFWLDMVDNDATVERVAPLLHTLRSRMKFVGLDSAIALCTRAGHAVSFESDLNLRPLDDALSADFLCDHRYDLPRAVVSRFARSMLIDSDPGLLHESLKHKHYDMAEHDVYYTIGEFVKRPRDQWKFDPHGYPWEYTAPAVSLDHWPVSPAPDNAAFTTISNWFLDQWMPDGQGGWYKNDKREAFEPFLDVPRSSVAPMELMLNLGGYEPEMQRLREHGWRVSDSGAVADPCDYRQYLQTSYGEFSCAKPGYVKLDTGWMSDRTICYLASGKPVIVQKTGESDVLPDAHGMFRFTTLDQARAAVQIVNEDYPSQSRAARKLAEDVFDARKVLTKILTRCL